MNIRVRKDSTAKQSRPSQEEQLLDYARQLKRHGKGRHAIHLRLSNLSRQNRQPHHRHMVAGAFNSLIRNYEAHLFWLNNFDLVFVGKDCGLDEINRVVLQIRLMFKDDHNIAVEDDPDQKDGFCDWYDIEKNYDDFLKQMTYLHDHHLKLQELDEYPDAQNPTDIDHLQASPEASPTPDTDAVNDGSTPAIHNNLQDMVDHLSHAGSTDTQPVAKEEAEYSFHIHREDYKPKAKTAPPRGPAELDKLERALESVDMSTLIREQKACALLPGENPHPIFTEHYVSIDEINQQILPGYNLQHDRWLFQRLTRILDRKVMFSLSNIPNTPHGVLSINVNVDSVLSTSFSQFRQKIQHLTHKPLILEFQLFDVIADMKKFLDAQERAKQMGCKLALDGMDFYSFLALDRRFIKVDFYKIAWQENFTSHHIADMHNQLISQIRSLGPERVILCHCDSQKAVQDGQKLGIHLFQGYSLDELI